MDVVRDAGADGAGHRLRAPGVRGDAGTDIDELLASLGDWPLWPDVEKHLPALGRRYRIGVLSNVDDDLFGRIRAARWWTRIS